MKITNTQIEEWLKPIIDSKRIQEYTLKIRGSSEKGDGYLSDITFVDIETPSKTYNLVIKSAITSLELRKTLPIQLAFQNEATFYTEVLPEFLQFQKEKLIDDMFESVPKCFQTIVKENKEVIILENLKSRGFSVHDRFKAMPRNHINEVVKTYGKLHALSFALRDQKPRVFENVSKNLQDMFQVIAAKVKANQLKSHTNTQRYQDIINAATQTKEFDIVEKCKVLIDRSYTGDDYNTPHSVIIHGDCWNNNFMFQYSANQEISNLSLIDFQLSHLASPIKDLSYFLFTCLSEEDLKSFDEINDLYYSSFCAFLRKLGSDPEMLFPEEVFQNHWKRFAAFGVHMMASVMKICLSKNEEVIDLAETAELGNFSDVFGRKIEMMDVFNQRILPIMRFAIERKFI